MKALILRNDAQAAVATSRALIDKGFQILCVESQEVAHALIRIDAFDLLVMDERVEGQLTHAIALSGERRNPYLSAIILTDRRGEDTDDLYALIPTLYALAGSHSAPALIARLAMSAVSGLDAITARVRENAATERSESARGDDDIPADVITAMADDAPAGGDILILDNSFAAPAMMPVPQPKPIPVVPPQPLERVETIVLRQVAALFGDQSPPQVHVSALQARSTQVPARSSA